MDYSKYTSIEFRRKFWKLFGASIAMTDPHGDLPIGYIKMKAWKLREDIKIYADEAQTNLVMGIQARQIIDFGATYDVTDNLGQPVVTLQRKGLRSTFVRDHWNILDGTSGAQFGYIQETSSGLAIARRYLGIIPYAGEILELIFAFVPETYSIVHSTPGGDKTIGNVIHRKNPLIVKMGLTFVEGESDVDKRISVAATALLSIIDANKN